MFLQQTKIVLSGSTHKLYNKDKFLPSNAFGTVSFANLIFCLQLLLTMQSPPKLQPSEGVWATTARRNKNHRYLDTKWARICFYSVLPCWSVHNISSVLYYFSELFHHGTNSEFISHWDYLVIDDLIIECPQRRAILLIAGLLKDTSNPSCIWISATYKCPHLQLPFLRLMMVVLLWSQMSHKRLTQLVEFISHKNSYTEVLSKWPSSFFL